MTLSAHSITDREKFSGVVAATPTASAVREVGEELGIELDPQELRPASTMFRRSLEPRVDIFFATSTWVGVPEIREPHKCTELVWVDPGQLPGDTLDFLCQAWADTRDGHAFREYGFAKSVCAAQEREGGR